MSEGKGFGPGAFTLVSVGHVPFAAANLVDAANWFVERCQSESPVSVRLANAYCVAVASSDKKYRELLQGDGIAFPDGQPVVDVMKMTSPRSLRPSIGRVRGPSFFESVMEIGQKSLVRHFFVGATETTLALMVDRAKVAYPDITIAGTYAPPFAPVSSAFVADICERIRFSDAHIVWVGLGAPKQDFVASAISKELGISTAGVGAAFDFLAGTVVEAPRWMQNSRLEWAYRLCSEPGRLWKRYLFGNARFVLVSLQCWRSNRMQLFDA